MSVTIKVLRWILIIISLAWIVMSISELLEGTNSKAESIGMILFSSVLFIVLSYDDYLRDRKNGRGKKLKTNDKEY